MGSTPEREQIAGSVHLFARPAFFPRARLTNDGQRGFPTLIAIPRLCALEELSRASVFASPCLDVCVHQVGTVSYDGKWTYSQSCTSDIQIAQVEGGPDSETGGLPARRASEGMSERNTPVKFVQIYSLRWYLGMDSADSSCP